MPANAIRANSLYTIVAGSWNAAQEAARSLGGYLVAIGSQQEQSFIEETYRSPVDLVRGRVIDTTGYKRDLALLDRAWIGLTDRAQEGVFRWESGEPVSFANWNTGQGSNPPGNSWDAYMRTFTDYGMISLSNLNPYWGVFGKWNQTYEGAPSPDGSPYTVTGVWDAEAPNQGIAEIPLNLSITRSSTPKEGAGNFITSINLSAGTLSSLTDGVTVYWRVGGITADDLDAGSLTGSGNISGGKLDIQHSLKRDSDQGEQFSVSVFSDAAMTLQIGSTASVSIQEGDPIPTSVSYQVQDATIDEGNRQLVAISRTGDISAAQTISLTTRDGSAKDGSDYQELSTNVSFAPGVASAKIELSTLQDQLVEGLESFDLVGGSITGGPSSLKSSWSKQAGTITIKDDDKAPVETSVFYTIGDVTIDEGGKAYLVISRSGDTTAAQTVSVGTRDGSAKSGADYVASSKNVFFAAGDTSESVELVSIDDSVVESSEAFDLVGGLISGGPTTLKSNWAKQTGTITIKDEDKAPVNTSVIFSIGDLTISEENSAYITVTRSGDTSATQKVVVCTQDGSASLDDDFKAPWDSNSINSSFAALWFNPGERSKDLYIVGIDDKIVEGTETFIVHGVDISGGPATLKSSWNKMDGLVTIKDNDQAQVPVKTTATFNLSDITVNEGDKQSLTISRAGDASAAQTISIASRDGSAKSGSDFQSINTNVFFAAGATSATIDLVTQEDQLVEGPETFEIVGDAITGGPSTLTSTWGKGTGTISISDNDVAPKQLPTDYLRFSLPPQTQRPGPPLDKFYDYVDRYPFTLKQAFIADYRAGKTTSQALWGQQHWINAGSKQGRVLEIVSGQEDINDYAAYVENYGTTLLDIYRKDPRASVNGGPLSLFAWGKDHYNTVGKQAGRQIDGGADFGAIIIQNPSLYARWQDARITQPTLSAFAFGYRNQNTIKQALGVKLGQDTQEKLTGQYVYGLGGNDVLTGTSADDILSGGFGDDLIADGKGGNDTVYGGPGRDVFRLNSGGRLNIRDYRVDNDFIQLGDGLAQADVQLVFDGVNNSTLFKKGADVLASVYGTNPNTFNFASQSDGIDNVFI